MYSRAHILLEREFKELRNKRNEGIIAFPTREDMMSWEAQIEGFQNSIWEGFLFHLTIDFTPEYNLVPPAVKFLTIPFHPNVDPHTGRPSIHFLDNQNSWNTNYTILSILHAIQRLLSNPVLENPVNLEAAKLLVKDESMYRVVVQKLFKPAPPVKEGNLKLSEKPQEATRVIKKISFNDYYKTWSTIATSQTAEHSRNPFVGDPKFMGQYYKWRQQNRQHHKQWKLKFELAKYRFDKENKSSGRSRDHSVQRTVDSSPTELSYESIESESRFYELEQKWKHENWSEKAESSESWEEEVDNLLAWTNALDVKSLNYDD
ncbi:ubiquitin-conjugating enzyme E2 U [Alexandromys fortis]|uniref:ubiquitin-conjugating enzyme E2 U n=1 Tax=Alexandromys fortis TaxID=100897 RepID=UPI0021528FC4|nr:ubiquitin-conjugating enzyme E2 U [Microtus fortis]